MSKNLLPTETEYLCPNARPKLKSNLAWFALLELFPSLTSFVDWLAQFGIYPTLESLVTWMESVNIYPNLQNMIETPDIWQVGEITWTEGRWYALTQLYSEMKLSWIVENADMLKSSMGLSLETKRENVLESLAEWLAEAVSNYDVFAYLDSMLSLNMGIGDKAVLGSVIGLALETKRNNVLSRSIDLSLQTKANNVLNHSIGLSLETRRNNVLSRSIGLSLETKRNNVLTRSIGLSLETKRNNILSRNLALSLNTRPENILLHALSAHVAVVETRYYRAESWTVNGLNTNKLLPAKGTTSTNTALIGTGNVTVTWGSRVFIRHADSSETELTSGVPVAEVSRSSAGGPSIQSATWTCPNYSLALTDALIVRVYMKHGTGSYVLAITCISEQLNGSNIYSTTWNFDYYTQWQYVTVPNFTRGYIYYGGATYSSGANNFRWV